MTIGSTRPRTRGDCINGERPCPYAGCRYHLSTDTTPNQTHSSDLLKLNDGTRTGQVGGLEGTHRFLAVLDAWDPSTPRQTCALDVAEDGPKTLEEISLLWGLTRERVRQIEMVAMRKIRNESPEIAATLGAIAEERDRRELGHGLRG